MNGPFDKLPLSYTEVVPDTQWQGCVQTTV